jgi:hypothetical protein
MFAFGGIADISGVQPEGVVGAQDMQKVKAAMALLKSESEKLGPAKIEGLTR